MLRFLLAAALLLVPMAVHSKPTEDELAKAKAWREAIPFNPGLERNPQEPMFVAVAHGGRILVSRDDGKTWEQVFFAEPGTDHSAYSCKTVAYDDGIFVTALGWGAPTTWLASDDGKNWTHLTHGEATLESEEDPTLMVGTYGVEGGGGAFVSGAAGLFSATSDLGKTWSKFNKRQFEDFKTRPKLGTHHIQPIYLGEKTGRFLALGDDRSSETGYFGHLFASDDGGATWKWLNPEKLYQEVERKGRGKAMLGSNGDWTILVQNDGAKAWRSSDGGETWEGPFETGAGPGDLSVVDGEFWIVGEQSRSSADGESWKDLPEDMPRGNIIASDKGTLISYARNRLGLLRSDDGGKSWEEVHTYEDPGIGGGAQGVRDAVFGYAAPMKQ